MADKTLLIKLKVTADGAQVVSFGRGLKDLGSTAEHLGGSFSGLGSHIGRFLALLTGGIAIGAAAKKVFDYDQEIEGTKNAIAGLLYANNQYVDATGKAVDQNTAWSASNVEAAEIMKRLQVESLKTAATVPQIGDAFATVMGAMKGAGMATNDYEKIITMTTRLTQTANAFKVPMEQIRQEVNSLISGQITEDSILAHRLGYTNSDIKKLQAQNKLVDDVIKRTEAYSKAADQQANSVTGKLVNTAEAVIATFARAFDPAIQRMKGVLDVINDFFTGEAGSAISEWVQRIAAGVERGIDWLSAFAKKHQELLKDIGSVALIAGVAVAGYLAIGAAIAILTSPITLTIAGIVALAYAWEKFSAFSEIAVGGRPIAAYLRTFVAMVKSGFNDVVLVIKTAFNLIWDLAKGLFGSLVHVILDPLIFVTEAISKLPTAIHWVIPGADQAIESSKAIADVLKNMSNAFHPLDNFKDMGKVVADARAFQEELNKVSVADISDALDSKNAIARPSELVAQVWKAAKAKLEGLFPELEKTGKTAAELLNGVHAKPGSGAKKLTDQQAKQLTDFKAWLDGLAIEASASGTDPVTEKLASIEKKRVDTIADAHKKAKESLGAIDETLVTTASKLANTIAQRETVQILSEKTVESAKRIIKLRSELELDGQKDIDDDRLRLISDALERELEENRVANKRWAADKREGVKEYYDEQIRLAELTIAALDSIDEDWARKDAAVARAALVQMRKIEGEELDAVEADRKRRDNVADDRYKQRLREQTAGTLEFAKRVRDAVTQQFGKIGDIIFQGLLDSRNALANAVSGFLADFSEGQRGLLKNLEGLAGALADTWRKALTNILFNGQGVASQLKAMWNNVYVAGPSSGGGPDYLSTGLNGAGFGAAVGGLFQKPGNYAGVGGLVGGGIGAVIGAYFGGAAGAKIGMMIGTAIGTAIGGIITKGQDWISVAIKNGVVSVSEQGISGKARNALQTQIQRQLDESTKGWRHILDLFPDWIQKLAAEKIKPVNLNPDGSGKTIEQADISDSGALNALGDFLANDMNNATFDAYKGAIDTAMGLMHVGAWKRRELFEHWGTLQGKELQDAVADYVSTMLTASDLRDKLKKPFESRLADSRKPNTVLDQIDDLDSRMALAVASMKKLTDVDDQIAAQKEINGLAQQRLDLERAILQQIDAQEKAGHQSNSKLLEQIDMAGKNDQQKLSFDYDRLRQIYADMSMSRDPEEISRLNAEMQSYVQQALGLSDSADNRSQLTQIVKDFDDLFGSRMDTVRGEIQDRAERPSKLMQDAVDDFTQAVNDFAGIAVPDKPKPGRGGEDDNLPTPRPRVIRTTDMPDATITDLVTAIRDAAAEQAKVDAAAPEKIAAAVREALDGMTLHGSMDVDGQVDFDAHRLLVDASNFTITIIRDNPNVITSRTRG